MICVYMYLGIGGDITGEISVKFLLLFSICISLGYDWLKKSKDSFKSCFENVHRAYNNMKPDRVKNNVDPDQLASEGTS